MAFRELPAADCLPRRTVVRQPTNIRSVKNLIEGRRFGFAPRPHVGHIALGLGVAVTIVDLMAWFAWGTRTTTPLVVAAYWLVIATAIVAALATVMALVERTDVDIEDRGIARLDLVAAGVATLLYALSAVLRSVNLSAAGAAPAALLLAIVGLFVLLADGVIAASLYSAREWEEFDDEGSMDRQPRRRAAR